LTTSLASESRSLRRQRGWSVIFVHPIAILLAVNERSPPQCHCVYQNEPRQFTFPIQSENRQVAKDAKAFGSAGNHLLFGHRNQHNDWVSEGIYQLIFWRPWRLGGSSFHFEF
jgi:hypothetical protein